jgi:hypothetical protein
MKTPPTPLSQRNSRDLERAAVTRTAAAAIAARVLLALSTAPLVEATPVRGPGPVRTGSGMTGAALISPVPQHPSEGGRP